MTLQNEKFVPSVLMWDFPHMYALQPKLSSSPLRQGKDLQACMMVLVTILLSMLYKSGSTTSRLPHQRKYRLNAQRKCLPLRNIGQPFAVSRLLHSHDVHHPSNACVRVARSSLPILPIVSPRINIRTQWTPILRILILQTRSPIASIVAQPLPLT
jgi:hypothetical protein